MPNNMSKLDFKGTEFDSFFVKKEEVENPKLQKNRITEKQNTVIAGIKKPVKAGGIKKIALRDRIDYVRVTTAIKKSTMKIIKDYMWENKIKTFDDALELFLAVEPINK